MKIIKIITIITLLYLFAVASAQFFNMAGLLFPDTRGDSSTVDPLDIDDIIEVHDSPYKDISPKEEELSYTLEYQLGLGGNTTT
jgi:hypothetical protein